jgi:hypothetical protein
MSLRGQKRIYKEIPKKQYHANVESAQRISPGDEIRPHSFHAAAPVTFSAFAPPPLVLHLFFIWFFLRKADFRAFITVHRGRSVNQVCTILHYRGFFDGIFVLQRNILSVKSLASEAPASNAGITHRGSTGHAVATLFCLEQLAAVVLILASWKERAGGLFVSSPIFGELPLKNCPLPRKPRIFPIACKKEKNAKGSISSHVFQISKSLKWKYMHQFFFCLALVAMRSDFAWGVKSSRELIVFRIHWSKTISSACNCSPKPNIMRPAHSCVGGVGRRTSGSGRAFCLGTLLLLKFNLI